MKTVERRGNRPMNSTYLTPHGAAKELGIDRRTVIALVERKVIPAISIRNSSTGSAECMYQIRVEDVKLLKLISPGRLKVSSLDSLYDQFGNYLSKHMHSL